MKLVCCIDNNYGMTFNNRRQSSDKIQVSNMLELLNREKIYITDFSKDIFDDENIKIINLDEINKLKVEDYFFDENILPSKLEYKSDEIILYKWNRDYPSDLKFDIDLLKWNLIESIDFSGSSHEKITREIYIRGK